MFRKQRVEKKVMRYIKWLVILSVVFLFGIVSSASAALILPNFNSGTQTGYGTTNTNPMTYTGNHEKNGTSYVAGKVYGIAYGTAYDNKNNTDYNSPYSEGVGSTYETSLQNKGGGVFTDTGNRIHGGYTANTDACSACHATHTAVSNDGMLLQWSDVLSACMACHDGTVTITYDVNAGAHNGMASSAGKFGFSDATIQRGHSAHAVNTVNVNQAPGGNILGTLADNYGTWGDGNGNGVQFTCTSCHAPHGNGGNARLLGPDPNGVASQKQKVYAYAYSGPLAGEYQPKIVDKSVYAVLMTATANPFIYNDAHQGARKNWVNGRSSTAVYGFINASTTAITYIYLVDYTIDSVNGQIIFKQDPINNPKAGETGVTAIYASYLPAQVVRMDVSGKLTNTETVTYVSGMSNFCFSCHTDFNVASTALGGIYSVASRHPIGLPFTNYSTGVVISENGLSTCLTCHWAHGTDDHFNYSVYITVYNQTYNGPIPTEEQMFTIDPSHSTVLKRIVNMGVCEACHQKGYNSLPTY